LTNNSKLFGIAAAGFILYSLLRKGVAAGTLTFFPEKVRSIDFEGLTPVMTIGIGVQNTSNQSFSLNSIAGSLYSNNYYVGNLSSFTRQPVAANSQQIIYVKIRLQVTGIVNDIIRAFENGNFAQEVEMKATANIDGLQAPVNLKYTIG